LRISRALNKGSPAKHATNANERAKSPTQTSPNFSRLFAYFAGIKQRIARQTRHQRE
jgi:hypothetical protein